MPTIEINGAKIHENIFGDDPSTSLRTGRTPIMLIRDSTIDSHTDCDSRKPSAQAVEITEEF